MASTEPLTLRPVLTWLRTRVQDERGSVSLETVIVFPVVLLLIFGAVQGALYFHARNVALAAAQEGVVDARVESGSSEAGIARAQTFLTDAGGDGVLRNSVVGASRSATEVTITVRGAAPSVLPGISGIALTQSASGPLERVTAP